MPKDFEATPDTLPAITKLIKASEKPLLRFLLVIGGAMIVAVGSLLLVRSSSLVLLGCFTGLFLLIAAFRFDYLHPGTAFLVPWITILSFSVIPISNFARPLQATTVLFIMTTVFVWVTAACAVRPNESEREASQKSVCLIESERPIKNIRPAVIGSFLVLYALAAVNVLHAGYVPFLSLVTTGDSSYLHFGIKSFYGAFLACANAMGCLCLYLYYKSRSRIYLLLFWSVLLIHLLFVTRQNMVTLLVEAFAIRSFTYRRLSRLTIVSSIVVVLALFSLLGTLRSGNIKEIIGIREAYSWVPAGLIWLYAYSYFNVLNLENMMIHSGAPYYDGSMWSHLLPSILRPHYVHASYLQLAVMNVSSYMYPIYFDVGNIGVKLWTLFWAAITIHFYRRAAKRGRFSDIATYACLFFCALFSFFVDFWFYLPIISQVVLFAAFQYIFFRIERRTSYEFTSP